MQFRAAILTASDKCASGGREDLSGPELERLLVEEGFSVLCRMVVEDEFDLIANALIDLCDNKKVDLILTTGGTGFSQRDVTPEATCSVIQRETPGIPEAMRQESLKITANAMLTRATAGIRNQTLIVNMPGSPKAARECFNIIRPALPHAMEILTRQGVECGN
jgi:molybdenum cofactor synthesis domain-containing protein